MSVRRGGLAVVAFLATTLAVAGAVAFACITPATISLSKAEGQARDVITITGKSFRAPDNAPNGVLIRWNGVDGPVLSEVRPDAEGNFSTTVTVPDGPPGYYVVTAVLKDASGENVPGTPGRALFQIQGAAASPPATEPPASFTPATPAGSAFPLILVAALGGVGLLLFVGGFVAVTRGRRGSGPVPARVRGDGSGGADRRS